VDGKLEPGLKLVNNSVALLKGKTPDSTRINFKIAGEKAAHRAIFTPKADRPDKDTYFWLGDGFVNPDAGKDLFVFAYRITNTHDNSAFPFKETGNVLIHVPAGSLFHTPTINNWNCHSTITKQAKKRSRLGRRFSTIAKRLESPNLMALCMCTGRKVLPKSLFRPG